jgi:hypothetical protein
LFPFAVPHGKATQQESRDASRRDRRQKRLSRAACRSASILDRLEETPPALDEFQFVAAADSKSDDIDSFSFRSIGFGLGRISDHSARRSLEEWSNWTQSLGCGVGLYPKAGERYALQSPRSAAPGALTGGERSALPRFEAGGVILDYRGPALQGL